MNKPASHTFKITGMDCAEEVAVLKREVGPVVGGEERLAFDVLNGRMTVSATPDGLSQRAIVDAVKRAGLGAEPVDGNLPIVEAPATFWQQRGRLVLTAASGLALAAAMITQHLAAQPAIANVLFGVAIGAGVWLVLPKAWGAIRRLQPDMNLLMTVAVLGAVAIGEWFEAAAVAFLFSVSLLLESWSVGRARRAIAALMDLAPLTAWLLRPDGSVEQISPQNVPLGAPFLVKPGERIPLDGKVLDGTSDVNQAPITGESEPIPKSRGDEVFAGTINGDGALRIESTRAASDTTLARIIRMV
ncbi:MAG: cation-transporting P-type ATPase, partial [Pirellulales bacterium]